MLAPDVSLRLPSVLLNNNPQTIHFDSEQDSTKRATERRGADEIYVRAGAASVTDGRGVVRERADEPSLALGGDRSCGKKGKGWMKEKDMKEEV